MYESYTVAFLGVSKELHIIPYLILSIFSDIRKPDFKIT